MAAFFCGRLVVGDKICCRDAINRVSTINCAKNIITQHTVNQPFLKKLNFFCKKLQKIVATMKNSLYICNVKLKHQQQWKKLQRKKTNS